MGMGGSSQAGVCEAKKFAHKSRKTSSLHRRSVNDMFIFNYSHTGGRIWIEVESGRVKQLIRVGCRVQIPPHPNRKSRALSRVTYTISRLLR